MRKGPSSVRALRKYAPAVLAAVALALIPSPPAVSAQVPDDAEPSTLDDVFEEVLDRKVEMTLDDAIALALERNLDLVIQRYRHRRSLHAIQEALGIFDLDLSLSTTFSENSRPISSRLEDPEGESVTTDNVSGDVGLTRLLPFGGLVGLSFDNSRFSSTDRNTQPNPSYDVNLGLSYSQPLLRGFGTTLTRQNVIVARNFAAASREDLRLEVELIVQRVSNTYWDLVEARDQLRVAEASLELALELHQMNQLREEAGVLAPLEVTRSEADVAARQEEIISRQAAVEDRSDELRGFFDLDRGTLWDVEIVPVTDPAIERVEIDLAEAVDAALAARPEIAVLRLANANLSLDARAARNAVKPQLDLRATWGINAREGTTAEVVDGVPILVDLDYFDTLDALLEREFEGWSLSLDFSYPLGNRTARARKAQAELALTEGDVALRQLEQQVLIEVRAAVRAVETAARQIESAQRSRDLAQKTLEVEELSYQSGQSTGFEILQSQERLREARSRQASAVTAYRRALAEYQRSIGTLLEANGIEIAE
jgi:outer membrane protein TolC